jgi:hypothetical protein
MPSEVLRDNCSGGRSSSSAKVTELKHRNMPTVMFTTATKNSHLTEGKLYLAEIGVIAAKNLSEEKPQYDKLLYPVKRCFFSKKSTFFEMFSDKVFYG